MKKHHLPLVVGALLAVAGCSGGLNLRDKIPDRRPDYRQSNTSHQLEIPPDLVSSSLNDQLNVPSLAGGESISYQDYNPQKFRHNARGFLDVLPMLHRVQVVEKTGQLPYILVEASPNVTWLAVKKYWQQSGIRLKVQNPALGLMETDWLEDVSQLPKTGISGFLDDIIKFTHDSGKRDRYRIRFSRENNDETRVTIIYTQAEEKALGSRKDPAGFAWQLADNDNPELQLEMTRRLALFVSSDLQRQDERHDATPSTAPRRAALSSLQGQPILLIRMPYAQAWQALGLTLDKTGFVLENQNYQQGTYQISAEKTAKPAEQGLLTRIFAHDTPPAARPSYFLRLAAQGENTIVVVQDGAGNPVPDSTAQAILQRFEQAL